MFDKLILPFRFIPDGSPEAQVPPPHGHIRIRAVFRPHLTSEETDDNWFDEGADDSTDGETPRGRPGPVGDGSSEAVRRYPDPATYMRVSHAFGDLSVSPKRAADDPSHHGQALLLDANPVPSLLEVFEPSGSQDKVVPGSALEESVAD